LKHQNIIDNKEIKQEIWMNDTAMGGVEEEGYAAFKYFLGRRCQGEEETNAVPKHICCTISIHKPNTSSDICVNKQSYCYYF
jgi:hypothetical protein